MNKLSLLAALGLFTLVGTATIVRANDVETIENPTAVETIEEDPNAVIIEGSEDLGSEAQIIDEEVSEELQNEEAGEVGEAVEGLETEAAE